VAHSTDKFDPETLPDPEFNPLLNPLLAAHMGRWAEVYFTNPPEKRGQAVSDLLRELKSESPMESAPVQNALEQRREEEAPREQESLKPPRLVPELGRTCSACSSVNSAEHKFCGMCGALLQSPPKTDESRFHATEPTSETNWIEPESYIGGYSTEYAAGLPLSSAGYGRRDSAQLNWPMPEADLPHFAVESESVPYRFRLYIGVAVALVLGSLLYMAWHGTSGSSGDVSQSVPSRVIPSAPPAPAPVSTQSPAATRTALPTDRPAAAPAGHSVESQNQPATTSRQNETPKARAASPQLVPVAAGSPTIASEQSGAEELATAERYLSVNNPGTARDNREAAQWLWKAVGKGNLAATMMLSDLYLRGDGVPKSCDQARLLLDAAARKGKASAAARLRNLQAFGCQ
jgi:hypothetical protein